MQQCYLKKGNVRLTRETVFPKIPRHRHAVRSDAEECVVDERLA